MTSSDSTFNNWDDRINEGWLERYVLGDLNDDERHQLEDHLTESEEARERLRDIEPMDEFMTQALTPFSVSNLEDRVIHAVRTRGRRRAPSARRFAVAASTLLALFSVGHVMDAGAYSDSQVAGYVDVVPQNPFAFFSGRASTSRLQGNVESLKSMASSKSYPGPSLGLAGGEDRRELALFDESKSYDGFIDKSVNNPADMPATVVKDPGTLNFASLQMKAKKWDRDEIVNKEEVHFSRTRGSWLNRPESLEKNRALQNRLEDASKPGKFGDFFQNEADGKKSELHKPRSFTSSLEVPAESNERSLKKYAGLKNSLESAQHGGGEGSAGERAPSSEPTDAIMRLNMIGPRPKQPSPDRVKEFKNNNNKSYYYRGENFTLKNRHGKTVEEAAGKDSYNDEKDQFSRDAEEEQTTENDSRRDDAGIKLIRSGVTTFEVESYNGAVNRLVSIARENEGYLASEESRRGANGRMKGSLVFRIRADYFGNFMANIRAIGDLKHQDIRVQDVTKAYFDLESRIESLQVRRKGLLKALEDRKGDLEAYVKFEEKLAGVISELEKLKGERKYMSNQVSFSTLRISLVETGIGDASAIVVNEKATMHSAVPDVESALEAARRRAKDLGAEVVASRVNRGRGDRDMSAHLGLEVKVSKFDQLVKAVGELGKVSKLTRSSDDQVKDGKTRRASKREDGVGELTITFYHLPAFTVEDNRMTIDVASAPVAYDSVKQLAQNPAVKIISKNIDSLTDKAKSAQFDLEIEATAYSDVRARLRSLGRVSVETGRHIEAVTPEGDPIPGFQHQVVRVNLTFSKLAPLTIETLREDLYAKDIKEALRKLKDEARTRNFRLLSQQGDEKSWGTLEFDLPDSAFESFTGWVASDKNTKVLGHVDNIRRTSLRENPEKMKEVPEFQEKRAKVTLHVSRLVPLIAEREEFGVKVEQVDEMYMKIRGLIRDVEGHHILDNHLDYEGKRAHMICHVPVEAYSDLVSKITALGEGNKVVHKRSWSHEANPDSPVPSWKPRVGRVEIILNKMLPTQVRKSDMTLFSDNPEDLISKITTTAGNRASILDSNLEVKEDGIRSGKVVLQIPLTQYDTLMKEFKALVDSDNDILANTGSAGNLADPSLDGEKLIALVTLTTTNSREGAVAPGGAGAYFGRTLSTMGNFFLLAFNKVLVGLAFIGPFAIALWMLIKMFRRRSA